MEPVSVAQCREIVGKPFCESFGDEEIQCVRDLLYCLADVIADAYIDLGNIDQSAFEPPGDPIDVVEKHMADAIEQAKQKAVSK
jgi:hypothetical protein